MTTPSIQTAQSLLTVTMLLMRSFSAKMRSGNEGLEPAQLGILMRLGFGVCTMSELAEHQSVRLPTVSRSVANLVKAGLVKRWTPEDNRRTTLLDLTPQGRKKMTSFKKKAELHVSGILAPLTEAERKQVDTALKILIKAMTP
jgi:DNA-binding MarR family transcriptional regulator